jgi:hypothetical protein
MQSDSGQHASKAKAGKKVVASSAVQSLLDDMARRARRKRALRDMVIYLPFLALFLAYLFTGRGVEDSYYINLVYIQNPITDWFFDGVTKKNFADVATIPETWQFIQNELLVYFWQEFDYDGTKIPARDRTYANSYNKLIGSMRIRSQRVSDDFCDVPITEYTMRDTKIPQFTRGSCFAEFSEKTMLSSSRFQFSGSASRETALSSNVSTAFKYQSCDRSYDIYVGKSRLIYDCGGFMIDIPFTYSQAEVKVLLDELYELEWLDRFTSMVSFEFFSYNAASNLFVRGVMVVEYMIGQGSIVDYTFFTFKILTLRSSSDYIILGVHVLFFLYLFYYFAEFFMDVKRQKWRFFLVFWNLFDTFNMVMFFIVILIKGYFNYYCYTESIDITTSSYPSFLIYYAYMWRLEMQLNSFNCILVFLRVLKFLSVNDRLNMIGRMLSEASGDLVSFAVMFIIVFLGYTTFGYLLYGQHLEDWRTWYYAAASTFFIVLGTVDYHSMYEINTVLTPIFFFSYIIIALFILFNMLLAIVNESYSVISSKSKDLKFGEQIRRWFAKLTRKKKAQELAQRFIVNTKLTGIAARVRAKNGAAGGDSAAAGDQTAGVRKSGRISPNGAAGAKRVPQRVLMDKLKSYLASHEAIALEVGPLKEVFGPTVPEEDIEELLVTLRVFDTNKNKMLELAELDPAPADEPNSPPAQPDAQSKAAQDSKKPAGSEPVQPSDVSLKVNGLSKPLPPPPLPPPPKPPTKSQQPGGPPGPAAGPSSGPSTPKVRTVNPLLASLASSSSLGSLGSPASPKAAPAPAPPPPDPQPASPAPAPAQVPSSGGGTRPGGLAAVASLAALSPTPATAALPTTPEEAVLHLRRRLVTLFADADALVADLEGLKKGTYPPKPAAAASAAGGAAKQGAVNSKLKSLMSGGAFKPKGPPSA